MNFKAHPAKYLPVTAELYCHVRHVLNSTFLTKFFLSPFTDSFFLESGAHGGVQGAVVSLQLNGCTHIHLLLSFELPWWGRCSFGGCIYTPTDSPYCQLDRSVHTLDNILCGERVVCNGSCSLVHGCIVGYPLLCLWLKVSSSTLIYFFT